MFRLITTTILGMSSMIGSAVMVDGAVKKKKPIAVIFTIILSVLTAFGNVYAIEHAFDDFAEKEEDKED